MNKWKDCS